MSDAVIVGIITGGITLVFNALMFLSSYIKNKENQAAREAKTDARLETLTDKVEKIEKFIYGGS